VVYRNLPPAKKAAPAPVEPPPPPDPPWTTAHPRIYFNNVIFERDSAEIGPGSHGVESVDKLIAHMEQNPHDTVLLEGHTCDIGSAAYNLALGQRRADAVQDYMIANGIDASRVSTVSHGLTRPAVPNDSDINRALNRRVVYMYRVVHVDRGSMP